jgi:hypothetical protein
MEEFPTFDTSWLKCGYFPIHFFSSHPYQIIKLRIVGAFQLAHFAKYYYFDAITED